MERCIGKQPVIGKQKQIHADTKSRNEAAATSTSGYSGETFKTVILPRWPCACVWTAVRHVLVSLVRPAGGLIRVVLAVAYVVEQAHASHRRLTRGLHEGCGDEVARSTDFTVFQVGVLRDAKNFSPQPIPW